MQGLSAIGPFLYLPASKGQWQMYVRAALAGFSVAGSIKAFLTVYPWSGIECIGCFIYLAVSMLGQNDILPSQGTREPHHVPMKQKRSQYVWVLVTLAQAFGSFFYATTAGYWAVAIYTSCLSVWIPANLRQNIVSNERCVILYDKSVFMLAAWRACGVIGAFAEFNLPSFVSYAVLVYAVPILAKKRKYTDASICIEGFVLPLLVFLGQSKQTTETTSWIALGFSVTFALYTLLKLVLKGIYCKRVLD